MFFKLNQFAITFIYFSNLDWNKRIFNIKNEIYNFHKQNILITILYVFIRFLIITYNFLKSSEDILVNKETPSHETKI